MRIAYGVSAMPDKFEREIEEILAKLDDDLPADGKGTTRSPISLTQKRAQKARAQRMRTAGPNPFAKLNPTTLLFAGAGMVFGGLIASGVWSPAIWVAFAGVVVFIGAFFWSFKKSDRATPATARAQGTFWRDRYINDRSGDGGIKDRFRRK